MIDECNQTKLNEEESKLFDELYRAHYKALLGFAVNSRECRNVMTAEDIVQETFCEAIRKIDVLKVHPNPGGWLMQTAKFKLNAEKKKASSRDVGYEDCETEPAKEDGRFEATELKLLMESRLNAHERKLFQLYYNYGYSAKEIAAIENISDGNFKVRMCRLKKKLLNNVDGICITLIFIYLHWIHIRL